MDVVEGQEEVSFHSSTLPLLQFELQNSQVQRLHKMNPHLPREPKRVSVKYKLRICQWRRSSCGASTASLRLSHWHCFCGSVWDHNSIRHHKGRISYAAICDRGYRVLKLWIDCVKMIGHTKTKSQKSLGTNLLGRDSYGYETSKHFQQLKDYNETEPR